MTKTAVLHIGTGKTGSTSIQHSLDLAQSTGRLGPVCFPSTEGRRSHNRTLKMVYRSFDELEHAVRAEYPECDNRFLADRRAHRRRFFSELRSADKAVISAENLSDFPPPAIAHLRDDLESLGYRNFHIVLYVRDPADYYLSITQQHLKMGFTFPPSLDPVSFRYDFRSTAESWEQAFPGRLTVRHYSVGNDVVADFSTLLQQYLGVALPISPTRKNTSLSAEAMQITQDYRYAFPPDQSRADFVRLRTFLESATDVAQTKPVLKNEVRRHIRFTHREDADWLLSRYDVDLGLQDATADVTLPHREFWRVVDVVESVDPAVVHTLLLRLARHELTRPIPAGSLPVRAAARAYRRVSASLRPSKVDARLRAFRDKIV